jgi:hypothetical protein
MKILKRIVGFFRSVLTTPPIVTGEFLERQRRMQRVINK